MANLADSNVQFFNSESSFGSSSLLSKSRALDLADELIDESETIFHSLKQSLLPHDNLVQWQEVNHIIHRAQILYKQTIPQNFQHLERDSNVRDEKLHEIRRQRERLSQLLNTYHAYQANHIDYQKFYEKYGVTQSGDFKKKSFLNIQLQSDVVQIIDNSRNKNLRGVNFAATPISIRENQINREKQAQQLYQQINRLKKRQRDLIKEKQNSQIKLKIEAEDRINNLIKLFKQQNNSQLLNNQSTYQKQQLQKQYRWIDKLNIEQVELQADNRALLKLNKELQQEVQSLRRIENSRISEQNELKRSTFSEQEGAEISEIKKLKKNMQNLKYQNHLLRAQLKRERQYAYKQQKKEFNLIIQENGLIKKQIELKNEEIRRLNIRVDEHRIQNFRLSQQIKDLQKTVALMNNKQINQKNDSSLKNDLILSQNMTQKSSNNKYSLHLYTGEGDQGYPYYELLNRQFKIRFRRACLREKELLYKASGLQIGSITDFIFPNTIKINLHITNFGDQEAIHNLRFKITNSKNNKIIVSSQKSHFPAVQPSHQIKYPISLIIKHYPIGATIFLCQYQYYGKNEEVRIVLPTHIFKMLSFKPRDSQFNNPIKKLITVQRKIGHNIKALKEYFNGAFIEGAAIRSTVYHEHSQTKIILDIVQKKCPQFEITAELRSGEQEIFNYLLKTLMFLLKKQS